MKRPKRQTAPLHEKLGPDSSTVLNPHARPAAGAMRPMVRGLPPVEDRTGQDHGVRFALQRGECPPGLDLIGKHVWRMVYRSVYADGQYDRIARFRLIVAMGGRDEAIRGLQQLEHGFAERIILYEADTLQVHHRDTEDTEK